VSFFCTFAKQLRKKSLLASAYPFANPSQKRNSQQNDLGLCEISYLQFLLTLVNITIFIPSKQIEIIQSNATMYFGVKIKITLKVLLKLRYMFRLQWSHLQAKCLRNKIVSGIPSDLREVVRDPFRLYIGCCCYYKNLESLF
jgi:hypothetical protein